MAASRTFQVRIGDTTFNDLDRGFKSLDKKLSGAIDKAAPRVARHLLDALNLVAATLAKRHGKQWRPGGSGENLFRRTGSGIRSIKRSIKVKKASRVGDIEGSIGAEFPMIVHEEGATVRPTRSRYLTVPLPAALDRRGVPLKRRAQDWKNTFVARSRRGSLLIFQRRGDQIIPLYVLKRQIKIRPRLKLGETIDKIGLPYFEKLAFDGLDAALDDAF